MLRFTAIAAVVLVAALAVAAIAQAPAPAPGPGAAPPRGGARMGAPANMDQMLDRLATRMGLTDAEKATTKKAVQEKMAARQALQQELTGLRDVAMKQNASDRELRGALQKYGRALAAYREKTKAIDAQLTKAVSLKARVGLTAVGVIDNGLGGMGMGRGMRAGGAQQPSAGGGRRQRGAPAPGPAASN